MLNKIKENKNLVYLVLGIVAAALVAPTAINYLSYEFNDSNVCSLVYYALLIAAAVVLAVFAGLKKPNVLLPVLLIEIADAFNAVVSIIQGNYYSSLVYGGIAIAVLIFYFAAKGQKKLFNVLLILLVVQAGFAVASTFGGSTIGLSKLIMLTIITLELYLGNKENKNEEV